jgi:imidazolonepropionase-like amidohydrolase
VVNVVDNVADIDRVWPRFIAGHPDFVKVFLLYSEEYERRRHDPKFLYKTGLDPALVPEIVKRAHAAGLRVSAHVYSAADFHNAVAGGVDDVAHMPGTGYDSTLGYDAFRIKPADAALAASHNVTVMTTLQWLSDLDSSDRESVVRNVIKPNVALLRSYRIPILLGSDEFRASPVHEAEVVASLGVFSNRELLELWTHTTPQSLFPRRKIGKLADGYEASFLVLRTDPIADFSAIHSIALRVKQGRVLAEPKPVPFPSLVSAGS